MKTKGYFARGRPTVLQETKDIVRGIVSGSYFIRISRTSGEHDGNGTHLLASSGGAIKVFDPDNDLVITFTTEKKRDFLLKARAELASHLPIIAMEPGQEPGEVLEPLLYGKALSEAEDTSRTELYRQLLSHFLNPGIYVNSAQYGSTKATAAFTTSLDLTQGLPLNSVLPKHREPIIAFLAASPTVPSHGDLISENVIADGNCLTIIDLELFAQMPFFYDALTAPFVDALRNNWCLASQINKGSLSQVIDMIFEEASMGAFSQDQLLVWHSYLVLHLAGRPHKPAHVRLLCSVLEDPRFGLTD